MKKIQIREFAQVNVCLASGDELHLIKKKTAKRIFIFCRPFSEKWADSFEAETSRMEYEGTIAVDRQRFEAGEDIHHKIHGTSVLVSNPRICSKLKKTQGDLLHHLGIRIPADLKTIKNAYRERCKALHPDHGGDIDAFLKLQNEYQMAIARQGE